LHICKPRTRLFYTTLFEKTPPTNSLIAKNVFDGTKRRLVTPIEKKEPITPDMLPKLYNSVFKENNLMSQGIMFLFNNNKDFSNFFNWIQVAIHSRYDNCISVAIYALQNFCVFPSYYKLRGAILFSNLIMCRFLFLNVKLTYIATEIQLSYLIKVINLNFRNQLTCLLMNLFKRIRLLQTVINGIIQSAAVVTPPGLKLCNPYFLISETNGRNKIKFIFDFPFFLFSTWHCRVAIQFEYCFPIIGLYIDIDGYCMLSMGFDCCLEEHVNISAR
jgi:hypothetical protein